MKGVLYSVLLASVLTVTMTAQAQTSRPLTKAEAAVAAQSTPTAPAVFKGVDAPSPKVHLKVGMDYRKARARLLAQGWRPLRDPLCLCQSMIRYTQKEAEKVCKNSKSDEVFGEYCNTCRKIPELSECDLSGRCYMRFQKNGKILQIEVYSDFIGSEFMTELRDIEVRDWYLVHPVKAESYDRSCIREAFMPLTPDDLKRHYRLK